MATDSDSVAIASALVHMLEYVSTNGRFEDRIAAYSACIRARPALREMAKGALLPVPRGDSTVLDLIDALHPDTGEPTEPEKGGDRLVLSPESNQERYLPEEEDDG